ncbi:hypothetical protein PF005_g4799 [Phytophthora fragariae]|uniref:Uncharacterized protein n=1 Tax=Phytophthora fragariae TaxID=53985 RepID=A0A6A4CWN4_9STRA|nr:hypothetical protein PF003_g2328 [Phytophthora fragariae]KAE8945217.1 hypothetical protein PF009_g5120 [Phytophthora fragariae]KAE9023750.1 hypothetical protein PF011_g3842 [Phytophthora fragariae]KAE9089343.1 hypothetical protein PF007_g19638 [Phytophthora fragariae]KAE9129710.1 hypothetical protein PF010_g4105 [Phytophthora fragariae]
MMPGRRLLAIATLLESPRRCQLVRTRPTPRLRNLRGAVRRRTRLCRWTTRSRSPTRTTRSARMSGRHHRSLTHNE